MNKYGRYLFIAITAALLLFFLWYFKHIVGYILIAYVFSLIGFPIVYYLGKVKIQKRSLPKSVRALIALLTIWTIIFLFFRFFTPLIIQQIETLSSINYQSSIEQFREPLEKVDTFITQFIVDKESFSIEELLTQKILAQVNTENIQMLFSYITSLIGSILIAVLAISFIAFFFLKDEQLFTQGILLFINEENTIKVKRILISVKHLLARYFIGILLQITGIICILTLGLSLVGIPFKQSLVLGLFMGVINVIPYIGPFIGILFGLVTIFISNLHLGFTPELGWLLFWSYIALQSTQIIDNVVFQPYIFSNSVKAHPLEIFLVILIAASFAGIIGMVLAIPLYTILRVIAKEFFSGLKLVQKITEKL